MDAARRRARSRKIELKAADELHYATLLEVSARLRAHVLSPIELVRATLDRIERLNPRLGAYYTVFAEEAMADARRAEAEIIAGRGGPLCGIPIAFKDMFELGPTTAGSRLLADHVAAREAVLVGRARTAGAVIVGKLATHEFALAAATLSDHFPPARNPWDPARTPGGSSTGAGTAVSTGMAFGAFGTDTGGSVRLPAAHCGVVGYKPTFGLLSRTGVIPLSPSLDHAGPLARSVADAAALFLAVCGYDRDDPSSSVRQAALAPGSLDRDLRGLRVAVPRDFWEPTCEPVVRERIEAAIVCLRDVGATVSEVRLGLSLVQVMATGYVITLPEAAAYHLADLRDHSDAFGPEFGLVLRSGLLVPAEGYANALRARAAIEGRVDGVLAGHDLLAMPTVGALADQLPQGPRPLSRRITDQPAPQYTWLANLHGGPAVSVPCGRSSEGLQVGLMLAGRRFDDATVLRAAHGYEEVAGWRDEHPPLFP